MSKVLKWVIILLSGVGVTVLIFLSSELFGATLGALPTVIVWAVIFAIGWKWTSDPKCDPEEDGQNDTSDSK